MAPLVMRYNFSGRKKGDTIRVPKPVRGAAAAKAEATAVTIQGNVELDMTIAINRHFEYSRLIEDIAATQALESMRRFYTQDAGYALAKQVDDDLFRAGTALGTANSNTPVMTTPLSGTCPGTVWENANSYYNNGGVPAAYADDTVQDTNTFDASGKGDEFLRGMIKKMDDADVPMTDRFLVVPPTMRKDLLGITRFVSSDFTPDRPVATGLIGTLYGIDVYVSSNCPVIEDATSNTSGTSVLDLRGAFLFHKDTFILAEQMGVRSQTQYKQEYLSTLYTADTLYGVQAYRPESGFIIVVPDA